VGSSAGFDQSLTDKAMSAAISQMISNLTENMTNKPWQSFVLAKEDDLYIISGGQSQGLTTGAQLYLYETGRTVKNPQTGALITLPGKKVGSMEVVYSVGEDEFNELSFVTIKDGAITEPLDHYFVSDK
jgi:hypothetical protein